MGHVRCSMEKAAGAVRVLCARLCCMMIATVVHQLLCVCSGALPPWIGVERVCMCGVVAGDMALRFKASL